MATTLASYLSSTRPKAFNSEPFYSEEGDFLSIFFDNKDHYAERVDEHMTVYKSLDGQNDFVGFKLKGVAHLLSTVGDFSLLHEDEDVLLNILLFAGKAAGNEQNAEPVYKGLAKKTKSLRVKARKIVPALV